MYIYKSLIIVVYFIGEYALSLCEYSSKPSMDASASGGTLKPSVIFSVTNKHAYEAAAVYPGGRHGGVDLDDGLFKHRDVVETAQRWVAEDAEHDGTQETAYAVDAKDVQSVVVAKILLHSGGEETADEASGNST